MKIGNFTNKLDLEMIQYALSFQSVVVIKPFAGSILPVM
jgi:hypothetical protein